MPRVSLLAYVTPWYPGRSGGRERDREGETIAERICAQSVPIEYLLQQSILQGMPPVGKKCRKKKRERQEGSDRSREDMRTIGIDQVFTTAATEYSQVTLEYEFANLDVVDMTLMYSPMPNFEEMSLKIC